MNQARRRVRDANEWHGHHGPIDIMVRAEGDPGAVAAAHEAAWQRFRGVLDELVHELAMLREPVGMAGRLRGPVARRMWAACAPHRAGFITPMAAVAGSVAEELIACYAVPGVVRAWVNNGGDIALHLAPGRSARVGVVGDISRLAFDGAGSIAPDGSFEIDAAMPVRGVATSGWRGRSFSLGIADSVTVLASTASCADAAATVIANAVDVDAPGIERRPARDCKDDSDLGDRLVTVAVEPLGANLVRKALDAGEASARALGDAGLVHAAVLICQGQFRIVGPSIRTYASLRPRRNAAHRPESSSIESSITGSVFA